MKEAELIEGADKYNKVLSHAGTKTTVCKNRFEIVCVDGSGINEAVLVSELRSWIAMHKQEEREANGAYETKKQLMKPRSWHEGLADCSVQVQKA